ncbi:hypothetical protein lerEdw1_013679 [Lerista edwardsae]|nr:hypothetical protein lerEdw1_013680 [Lerista edwardsae]KAJ6640499.1 hypothetical protein lerEdw1_013679 [Lerista edwardsae]
MFGQQQLQQQLLQLQHLLQHQAPPQQQAPPPASRGVTPSQQQQMLNLRPTNHTSLLSTNPLLQRALLIQQMQGNLRGFSMAAAPVLQQFFPQATRHSLLGPPPVGVSLKPTRLAFPGLPFQRQNRTFRKDFLRVPERKREADPALSSSSSQGQGAEDGVPLLEPSAAHAETEQPHLPPSDTPAEASLGDEPATKRLRSGDEDSVPDGAMCLQQVEDSSIQSHEEALAFGKLISLLHLGLDGDLFFSTETDPGQADEAADSSIEKALSEELKTSERKGDAHYMGRWFCFPVSSKTLSNIRIHPGAVASEMML